MFNQMWCVRSAVALVVSITDNLMCHCTRTFNLLLLCLVSVVHNGVSVLINHRLFNTVIIWLLCSLMRLWDLTEAL